MGNKNKNPKTTEFLLISAETYTYPTTSRTVTGAPVQLTAPIQLAVKAGLKHHANESFLSGVCQKSCFYCQTAVLV